MLDEQTADRTIVDRDDEGVEVAHVAGRLDADAEPVVGPKLADARKVETAEGEGANLRQEARTASEAVGGTVPTGVEPSEADGQGTAGSGSLKRRAVLAVLVMIALAAGVAYGHYWWQTGRFLVSTDDAYVGAHGATLSPKVSGYIEQIDVSDNSLVKAGDVIARIDEGDYQLALRSARDQVATQKASIARFDSQILAQKAAVDQAKAELESTQAAKTRTSLELKRQQELVLRDFASQQKLEQARAAFDQATASVTSANAGIEAANANIEVLKAQQEEARRVLAQHQTAEAKAERDLSFTIIRAPFDGVIGNRAMQVGDYVQPTQRLASLVPLSAVYVDANFKETQLADLKPGQPVTISVDALPGRTFEGRVVSIAPASGSVFSLLPPDNATGNFTKIVQRLPVRIAVPVSIARENVLKPGMSVIASVNTKPGAEVADLEMNDATVERAAAR